MANAKECDVCGRFYSTDFKPEIIVKKTPHGYGEFRIDLCEYCQKKLEDFLSEKKQVENDE